MSHFFELVGAVFGLIFAAILAIVISAAAYTTTFSRWGCEEYGKVTGYATSFTVSSGCYVKLPDGSVVQRSTAEAADLRKFQHRYQIEAK